MFIIEYFHINLLLYLLIIFRVFDECSLNNLESLTDVLSDVIGLISTALESRQMNELKKNLVLALQNLLTVKPIFDLLPLHSSFYGENKALNIQTLNFFFNASPKQNAWHLQNHSLFGHLIRPSSLDENMFMKVPLPMFIYVIVFYTHSCLAPLSNYA